MLIMTVNKRVGCEQNPWNQAGNGDWEESSISGTLFTDKCWSLRCGERTVFSLFLSFSPRVDLSAGSSTTTVPHCPALSLKHPALLSLCWLFLALFCINFKIRNLYMWSCQVTRKPVGIFKFKLCWIYKLTIFCRKSFKPCLIYHMLTWVPDGFNN